uniref:Uncharacterized protein n=1 Tax=Amphimedon queenslandica TaxID=400682 RepID=A0A1X7US63_AMPQE
MEQVLSYVAPEMAQWLKEHKPESLEKISLSADEYSQIRSGENVSFTGKRGEGESRKFGNKPPYSNRDYENVVTQEYHSTLLLLEERRGTKPVWQIGTICPSKKESAIFAGVRDDVP